MINLCKGLINPLHFNKKENLIMENLIMENLKPDKMLNSESNYLLEDSLKNRLNFLGLPYKRKVEILKSMIGNFDGLTEKEVKKFIRKATKFHTESIQRELNLQSDRKNLVNRNHQNICNR